VDERQRLAGPTARDTERGGKDYLSPLPLLLRRGSVFDRQESCGFGKERKHGAGGGVCLPWGKTKNGTRSENVAKG